MTKLSAVMPAQLAYQKIVSSDRLALMSPFELDKRTNILWDALDALPRGGDPRPIQVEIAYCQREWQIREDREEANRKYLANRGRPIIRGTMSGSKITSIVVGFGGER